MVSRRKAQVRGPLSLLSSVSSSQGVDTPVQPTHQTTVFFGKQSQYTTRGQYREGNHIGEEVGTGWIVRVDTFLALLTAGATSGLAIRAWSGDIRA